MPNQSASWPGGRTYVFQGTVLEDATGGTHIASLTMAPGAGNEVQLLYGQVIEGNTTTAQTTAIFIDDGTNVLGQFIFAGSTAASVIHNIPISATAGAANANNGTGMFQPFLVSGAMRFVMRVTTAAVSITHTFSIVLRVWGDSPTFTLADTVGTPTLTTNTSGFF